MNTFAKETLGKAAQVRVAFFDVDGVLTDGGLFIDGAGETTKRFHTLDGHGLKLLQQAGITPVVISGRDSPALRARLAALGISRGYFGMENKQPMAQTVLAEMGCGWQQAAGMGDDWPDLPVLLRCGFSCAPPNAHAEVLSRVDYVTRYAGGAGAAREFCDLLLHATGHYQHLLSQVTKS